MPKISIILPCYNVEKYIAKSIQSVLNQTYTDFELLVVIDGSPDNSKAIAESFHDNRITIYEKPNGGLSDARNYGLERALGEFVYFMDSDDWIEPDLAEEVILLMNNKNLDLVVFGYIQDNEDKEGNLIGSKCILPEKDVIKRTDDNINMDSYLLGLLGYAWNKVYKRNFLLKNNLIFKKGMSLVEDIVFNTQVYRLVDELHFINKGFYHYVNRPEKTLMKMFHSNTLELKVIKIEYLELFLLNWKVNNSKMILSDVYFEGLKYVTHNLYFYNNDLRVKDQLLVVRDMFQHDWTKQMLNHYKPKNMKDMFLKLCVKFKFILLFHQVMKSVKK